jgi:hypothetical protein
MGTLVPKSWSPKFSPGTTIADSRQAELTPPRGAALALQEITPMHGAFRLNRLPTRTIMEVELGTVAERFLRTGTARQIAFGENCW